MTIVPGDAFDHEPGTRIPSRDGGVLLTVVRAIPNVRSASMFLVSSSLALTRESHYSVFDSRWLIVFAVFQYHAHAACGVDTTGKERMAFRGYLIASFVSQERFLFAPRSRISTRTLHGPVNGWK